MKRKTINQSSILRILFLFYSLFLWNCESEEVSHFNETNLEQISVKRHEVAFEDLEKHNSKAYEIITGLTKEKDIDFTSRTEDVYSEEHDLYYNLDKIYHITGENYEQFSFLVRSSESTDKQFENYLLVQYADQSFRQFIITYDYTTEDKSEYDYSSIRELEGGQLFSRSISSCPNLPQLTPISVEVCTYTQCTGTDLSSGVPYNHSYGQTCGCSEPGATCTPPQKDCETTIQWVMTCPDGGTNDGNPNDPNDGQTGGGNTGDDTTNDDVPVIPVEETPMDRILECMNTMSLTGPNVTMPQSLIDSLLSDPRCHLPIDDFIQEQGCSYENKVLVIDAARACLNDDWESYFLEHPEEFQPTFDIVPEQIIDINEYMDCFNSATSSHSFSMTVYVDQPVPGSRDPYAIINPFTRDIDVGHTFVSLTMTDAGGISTTQTIGYYPDPNNIPSLSSPSSAGVFRDNGQTVYDVSITGPLSFTEFTNVINKIRSYSTSTYNLNSLNCTDIGIQSAQEGGMTLPDTLGSWGNFLIGNGAGSNPGDLGEDIREMADPNHTNYDPSLTINTNQGNGPVSNGPCN